MSDLEQLLDTVGADIDRLVCRVQDEYPDLSPQERAQIVWCEWVQDFNVFIVEAARVVSHQTAEDIHSTVLRLGTDKILGPTIDSRKGSVSRTTTSEA